MREGILLDTLKQDVCAANLLLVKHGLVTLTWGNVSGIDREAGMVVIKPSGVDYDTLEPDDMVVVELLTGKIAEGSLRPSSDTPTHIELYKSFREIGGIVHTHSRHATAFAQAVRPIPTLGTTHADYFYRDVPCTRELDIREIRGDYEAETGRVIVERFAELGLSPLDVPAVLAARHGPFAWGESAVDAVHNAVVLETVAEMAWYTMSIMEAPPKEFPRELLDKHFFRKHGSGAYYGQTVFERN